MSEEQLIRFCAPTLAGLKTGSLFSCAVVGKEALLEQVRELNDTLGCKGLHILPLRFHEGRALIYVYRPRRLQEDLRDSDTLSLLYARGYPAGDAAQCLARLVWKLQQNEEFPHEIGLFLGYPPEDVRGFIDHNAGNYQCSGCWKVYGDAARPGRGSPKYKRCTQNYFSRWAKGASLERLTVAT